MADDRPSETYSPAPRSRVFVCIAALLISGGLGCDREEGTFPIELSWSFVDGRPCDLAAVLDIEISSGTRPARRLRCTDGIAPNRFVIHEASLGEELTVEALAIGGAVLYRGRATLEGESAERINLLFVGGQ